MKKLVLLLMLLAMLLTCGCSTSESKIPDYSENGSPSANLVAREMGLGLNLGNTMEAYEATDCEKITFEWIPVLGDNTPTDYETCWGAVVTTQEVINEIKEAGFNTVRIPVFWGNMMENDGTWTINPDYLARVKEIVDYCENAGMYSVINIHHFDEFVIRRNDLENCKKIFNTLWTQIADYFRDYPYTVVFEGFNEYLGGKQFNESGELVEPSEFKAYLMTNELNQVFVDAVRATGSNNSERVLIVSGYYTNIDKTTSSQFVMPNDSIDNRLMVSVHYVDNNMYWSNRIGTQDWLDYIEDQCTRLENAFSSKDIPVFLGETTAIYPNGNFGGNAIYTETSECLEIVLKELTERGFVPVIWDTNDNFYSRTEFQIKDSDNAKVIKKIAKTLDR